ncbi:MAG: transketolase [Ruminococcaceae bacterium]|nr:transketolase [Oscillospiraceae bacterium]
MEQKRVAELKEIARNVRIGIIDAVHSAASGHPGGSLSSADLMTYLYFEELNVDPADPEMADRDRFVLSKGHCSPALYSVLAHRGYFEVEHLKTFRKTTSNLQGHPDKNKVPGVDMSTGSLGQGVSVACGMALAAKLDNSSRRVWALVGDGEAEEGQVWESAMFAAHYNLDNLCYIIDWNGLQIDGAIDDVIGPAPFDTKFAAFGWNVVFCDAHDFNSIEDAFSAAKACKGKPTVIIAKSTKGKGVSFMENQASWHGSAPNAEQYAVAINDLKA